MDADETRGPPGLVEKDAPAGVHPAHLAVVPPADPELVLVVPRLEPTVDCGDRGLAVLRHQAREPIRPTAAELGGRDAVEREQLVRELVVVGASVPFEAAGASGVQHEAEPI